MSAAAVLLYAIAVFRRDVSIGQLLLSAAFLAAGAPLGYDTLMYSWTIQSGSLGDYGVLWAAIQYIADLGGAWWMAYVVVYGVMIISFFRLAQLCTWPSLMYAALITLPGIGFSFLGLLRQGLSTAFVALFFVSLTKSKNLKALVYALLAYLAHPAASIPVVIVLLLQFSTQFWRALMMAAFASLIILMALVIDPALPTREVANASYYVLAYLTEDTVQAKQEGHKLFAFWAALLVLPVALAVIRRQASLLSADVAAVGGLLLAYAFLIDVSTASTRIVWLFLPLVLVRVISRLADKPQSDFASTVRFAVFVLSAGAAIFAIALAPVHFWQGTYDHEVELR